LWSTTGNRKEPKLFKIRNGNTHSYSLYIFTDDDKNLESFKVGDKISSAIPVLEFCRSVLELFDEINIELDSI
jgi:hypothetical protein